MAFVDLYQAAHESIEEMIVDMEPMDELALNDKKPLKSIRDIFIKYIKNGS